MTRPELHALVDIVMDARERTISHRNTFTLAFNARGINFYDFFQDNTIDIYRDEFDTFSDFTQAVQEYIKTLEK
jgi:hypothetical protein